MRSSNEYLALADRVFLKTLEFPAVYSADSDELYEVDPAGFEELARCDGTLRASESRFPDEFLEFCLDEGLLIFRGEPTPRTVRVGRNESPSLRYLMLEVTDRCNLACRHCYLGDGVGRELQESTVLSLMDEFDDIGGLRLIVTGGEPLLYSALGRINEAMSGRLCRTVLITNATLLDDATCGVLEFDEVQVSVDGMRAGHDSIRGEGSFDAAMRGLGCLKRAGRDISIATMIHTGNVLEMDGLAKLVEELGAVSWTLDVPCQAGRLAGGGQDIVPSLEQAAECMERAFGSEQHRPSGGYACGAHLASVDPAGTLVKCGFYPDWTGGPLRTGLRKAWRDLPRLRLEELECDCEFVYDCGGGCRFRAETSGGRYAPDPLKCAQFGVSRPRGDRS